MNKTDLVNAVATKSELTKADASKAVDALLETISSTLGEGEKIQLIGFGTFEVRERAAVQAVTLKRVKKCKFQHQKYPHLKLVKN